MSLTEDLHSLTTFRNNTAAFMRRLKKTNRPVMPMVNGKPAAVVQDAAAYPRLLDIAAQADALEGIRHGRDDARKRRTHDARKALKAFRRNNGLSR